MHLIPPAEEEIQALLEAVKNDMLDKQTRSSTLGYMASRILTAVHSQLIGTDEFGVLADYEALVSQHPIGISEDIKLAIHDCRMRFVVGEVRSGKSNRLRMMSWQLLGILLEDVATTQAASRLPFEASWSDEEILESIGNLDGLRDEVLLTPWEFLDRDIRSRQALVDGLKADVEALAEVAPDNPLIATWEERIEGTRISIESAIEERRSIIESSQEDIDESEFGTPLVAGGRQAADGTYLNKLFELAETQSENSDDYLLKFLGRYLLEVNRVFLKWNQALSRLPAGSLRACPHLWLEDHDGLERFYLNPEGAPTW